MALGSSCGVLIIKVLTLQFSPAMLWPLSAAFYRNASKITITTCDRIKPTVFLRLRTPGIWDATPWKVSGAADLEKLSPAHITEA